MRPFQVPFQSDAAVPSFFSVSSHPTGITSSACRSETRINSAISFPVMCFRTFQGDSEHETRNDSPMHHVLAPSPRTNNAPAFRSRNNPSSAS
ncbi:uncharacterized protein BDZ99DRAFT_46550 [Mytilinidion resinicola]|uniref:Uncharacterized protein n=1 Tax=Mytilinidion resinicola TaxID=574789 RepID=A0A6A6YJX1_9PEZI|nr:uncharacterized protein BDZ99DRAFT_46550 [Mytilinidion resinicola]KAF2809166.1 hypothetical protein BDZ99DRAFT_46550 [Mytilinidion resinicola]